MGLTYKDSGVDIKAGEETVDKIKPLIKETHNENVLSDIGLFGAFYDAKFSDFNHPVLVSSVDGVGTKLKVAVMAGIHNTVGQDLVNHCTDDILTSGAKPLFFLDYFATGKLDPNIGSQVISGFAKACKDNNCALIGGETAEMPGMYQDGDYDMSGTIVGIVDKENIINGSKIERGNILIGLESNGLHTNGYSLARKALFPKYKIDENVKELGETIAEALLKVHISYLNPVHELANSGLINGISHITGGGIIGNTKRILPDNMHLNLDWGSWNEPPIFDLIRKEGNVNEEIMREAFNLGLGMILIANKNNADKLISTCSNYNAKVVGEIA